MVPPRLVDTIPDHFNWKEYGKVIMAYILGLKVSCIWAAPKASL
jgi:hypothetical protein